MVRSRKRRGFDKCAIQRADRKTACMAVLGAFLLSPATWAQFCGDGACQPPETRCNCSGDCGAPPAENCTNAIDDDCDGMNGCADPGCSSGPDFLPCNWCGNGICSGCERCGGCGSCPPDCSAPATWETSCTDGFDNDCNGIADCSDPQCLTACCGNGACNAVETRCNCPADCGSPPATETNCTDGRDNDCDGAADCPDADCFSQSICCGNGTCSAWEDACDCPADCGPPTGSETICNDLKDNDCDGFGDCSDLDCFGQGAACCGDDVCTSPAETACNCPHDCGPPPPEFCHNTIDGDCDGMAGCTDYLDCSSVFGFSCSCPFPPCPPACPNGGCTQAERCTGSCPADCGSLPPSEINCANGADDDCNFLADCSDPNCLSVCCGNGFCDPAETSCNCTADCGLPLSAEAQCTDSRDNDCDGLIDCADPECHIGPETDCADGLDEDCDGPADCADLDCCSASPSCYGECTCCDDGTCDPLETQCSCPEDCGSPATSEVPGVTCQDGLDDDCDARTDCDDTNCVVDADGDGFAAAPCGFDCDDDAGDAFPGAFEACGDAIDNNCNGQTDCDDPTCHGQSACCQNGACDPLEMCSCPADCGSLTSEAGFCFDNLDNDCDGLPDCSDHDCCTTQFFACQQQFGCGNGNCQPGENTCNCQCDCGYPATVESLCSNNGDEDCDGLVDCHDPDCFGPDGDGDGFRPDLCGLDCDDTNPTVHPGAAGLCGDGVDNDCDSRVDCSDLADCAGDLACCDGDALCESFETPCTCPGDCGNPAGSEVGLCFDGLDNDCDGVDDCDDSECRLTQPSCQSPVGCGNGSCQAPETRCNCSSDCGAPPLTENVCGDGQDNDCDVLADCNDADCQAADADGDGFVVSPCGPDCNDTASAIHPGAAEVCNDGVDNDCDAATDCDDGGCHGDQACEACCSVISFMGTTLGFCYTRPFGTCGSAPVPGTGKGAGTFCQGSVLCCGFTNCTWDATCCAPLATAGTGTSCAGIASTETVCADGRNNDCDAWVDCDDSDCQLDVDGDGYFAPPCGDDCADADPCAQAGGTENCADGIDNDCDFAFDCADADCQVDADNDGFDAAPCGTDCADANPGVNPAAAEACTDAVDNDCDAAADCADSDCQMDADDDGFDAPPCGKDCNDADPDTYPGADELCDNAADDDCDTDMDCDDIDCATDPECQPAPPALTVEPSGVAKNRFTAVVIPSSAAGLQTALRVELGTLNHPRWCCTDSTGTSCSATPCDLNSHCAAVPGGNQTCAHQVSAGSPDYSALEGKTRYVNSFPGGALVCADDGPPFNTTYRCATLGCDPEYRDWATDLGVAVSPAAPAGLLHITGDAMVPSSTMHIGHIAASCGAAPGANTCTAASAALAVGTSAWGDITSAAFGPSDGKADVLDIPAVTNKLKGVATFFGEYRTWLKQRDPAANTDAITVVDLSDVQDGVLAKPYPVSRTIDACPHD